MLRTNSTRHLAEIMSTPDWRVLTEQQQTFLASYIAVGMRTGIYSAVKACEIAYPKCKNTSTADIRDHQLSGNKRLRKILDLHLRRTAMDSLLEDLHIAIKKSIRRDNKASGLSPDTTRAIESFEKHPGQTVEESIVYTERN